MSRNSRLSRTVKEAVAEILRSDISDPRLRMVTITDADVTSDQSYGTVWYSLLTSDVLTVDPRHSNGDRPVTDDEVAAAFDAARGRIQGLLGRRLTSRRTPQLQFELDPVADQAARVEALIRKVRDGDSQPSGSAAAGSRSTDTSLPSDGDHDWQPGDDVPDATA